MSCRISCDKVTTDFLYRCSLLCPFNTMVERIYPVDSSRQKNRNTKVYGSVQCRRTQRRPVKALVELVKSDHAAVSSLYCCLGSIGHRAFKQFKPFVRTLRAHFNFL